MKKLIYMLILFSLLFIPFTVRPSYEINLKNGARYIVPSYWEEGGVVKFYIYGGIVGVQKEHIRSIEESRTPYHEPEQTVQENKTDTEVKADHQSEKGPDTQPGLHDGDPLKERKQGLIAEMNEQMKILEEDKKGGKAHRIERRIEKIKEIRGKLDDLENEVKESNQGKLPDWWDVLQVPDTDTLI